MQSTATASAEPAVERMDLCELRDDLARSFAPANAHERMLVTQIAQSFLRLQKAQNAEAQYFEKKRVYEAITTDFNTYKAITRYTSDCERAWRHAVLMLERTQRRRIKTQGTARIFAGPPLPDADAPQQPETDAPQHPDTEMELTSTGETAAINHGDRKIISFRSDPRVAKVSNGPASKTANLKLPPVSADTLRAR